MVKTEQRTREKFIFGSKCGGVAKSTSDVRRSKRDMTGTIMFIHCEIIPHSLKIHNNPTQYR